MKKRIVLSVAGAVLLGLGVLVSMGQSGGLTNVFLKAIATAVEALDNAIKVDDAAFTPATTSVSMAGAEFDDTSPDSVDEGDAGAVRMSANRNLYITIRDAAGGERGANVDASGQVGVVEASAAAIAADANELTAAPIAKALTQFSAVVAGGPTKAPLQGAQVWARKIVLTACKATGTANTGIVYVGDTNLVDTTACGTPLAPGDSLTIDPGLGCKVDMNTIYVDGGTAADGVTGFYIPL
ncbi:MAG TPA: hypothetical protein VFH53_00125 [Phycisphaerae bacterium]|nr:hypothetical protein [Phycisphaerae bacterium]